MATETKKHVKTVFSMLKAMQFILQLPLVLYMITKIWNNSFSEEVRRTSQFVSKKMSLKMDTPMISQHFVLVSQEKL